MRQSFRLSQNIILQNNYCISMESKAAKFSTILVITLSQCLAQLKKQAMRRIKLRSINQSRKKLMMFNTQQKNNKNSNEDSQSYRSISDFKPLINIYSSVKIYEEDFQSTKFQTKKQKIKQVMQQKTQKHCKLQDWMIARKAKTPLPQLFPKSEFSLKPINSYSQQALRSIKLFKFEDFCQSNLKKKRSLIFYKEINTLDYRKSIISDSLSNLPDTKVQIAIDIFTILLTAGSQIAQAPYPKAWYVWKLISLIIQQIDDVKEEAYFQVIKQMDSQKIIYYQILACLSATIQPSSRMYLPLLNFIYYKSLDLQNQSLLQYLNYAFFSLIKNFQNPRKAVPSMFQLFCYMNLRKIPLIICFPRQNIFFMQSYSTVEQILNQLVQLYGIKQDGEYLFNIEGTLLQKGSILDNLNKTRKNESQQLFFERFVKFKGYQAFLVIKNMLQINESPQNYLIMFNYIVNQYRRGLFLLNSKLTYEIGALIMVSEIEIQDCYEFSLAKCFPKRKYENGLSQQKKKKMQRILFKQYSSFKGSKMEARRRIVEILSKSKAFLTHFFFCNVFIQQNQYTQAWVGIKTDCIIVVQPGTNRILLTIQYQKIKKWGYSSSQICLKVDKIGDLHIQNSTLDAFISIFTSYISYLKKKINETKQSAELSKLSNSQSINVQVQQKARANNQYEEQ